MREAKEFKYIFNNKANIRIGTLDREGKDRVIYVKASFWITPKLIKDFYKDINHFTFVYKNAMKNYIYSSKLFNKTCILDFVNKTDYMKVNRQSYVSIEAYLRQEYEYSIKEIFDMFSPKLNIIIEKVTNEIEKREYSIIAKKPSKLKKQPA